MKIKQSLLIVNYNLSVVGIDEEQLQSMNDSLKSIKNYEILLNVCIY